MSAEISSGATISSRAGASGSGTSISGGFAPGTLFAGRYRIERMLGAGGMGAVYEAWDHELGVTIALKVIRSDITADPDAARDFERRFKQELLLARQVSHPNVVRIHDLGDASGVKYITMSYVMGSDLAALLKPGPLPIDRARHLALQLASGLAAAHDVGIAHRDLKPQNILIGDRDHLYISDFGLAKSLETTTAGLTRTGEFLGTPRYVSPEQVEGKPTDFRADLYALGLIVYEMVTGGAPFAGPSAIELMLQRVQEPPKSARARNPDVPEYLERIIMRCLEKDPALRYQRAHEIVADLRGEQSTASAIAAPPRTVSVTLPIPASRLWPALAAMILIATLALAVPATRRLILPAAWTGGTASTAAAPAAVTRIAVLPFAVAGQDSRLAEVAAGIDEALASKLFQLKSVNVASAAAVQRAAKKTSLDEIGRDVGATFVVTGTVQGAVDKLRVTANLEDLSGHGRVWSKEFAGVSADLLTLEDRIFTELASHLGVSPTSGELAGTVAHPTENIDAYAEYLKGRNAMRNEQDIAKVKAALGFYEEALKKDPRFALAYTGIADSSLRLYRASKDKDWSARAVSAAEKARELDDNLVEVHLSLGNVYQAVGRTTEAIVELKHATDLAPNSDDAYRRLGRAYLASGRGDEAIDAYKKAVAINPYHWVNSNSLGVAYMQLARYDAAIAAFKKVIDLAPDNVNGYNDLGAAYLQVARYDDAIAAFQSALKVQPIANTYTNLAMAYAYSGRFADAVPMFQKAVEMQPNAEAFVGNLADGYRWAGERDRANVEYDKAIALALKALQVNPRDATAKESLALYYAKKGDGRQARKFIGDARAIDSSSVELMYGEAVLSALLNDRDRAFVALERALEAGYPPASADGDPDLRSIRSDSRYAELKARLAKQPALK